MYLQMHTGRYWIIIRDFRKKNCTDAKEVDSIIGATLIEQNKHFLYTVYCLRYIGCALQILTEISGILTIFARNLVKATINNRRREDTHMSFVSHIAYDTQGNITKDTRLLHEITHKHSMIS